ncbi:hypothetical protein M378DRAFT_802300 [Amanita muscaria Koide BX008]|uniref:Uncharacterized protein n=1 Tax=Amanita muscaria (strain Koide BX008) TaxID=946122 RepID=A0A0C2X0H8_AMAMK|nr:hypothetical protein M378DRAFT_802300 [Amanita muscaria Koide BX008]
MYQGTMPYKINSMIGTADGTSAPVLATFVKFRHPLEIQQLKKSQMVRNYRICYQKALKVLRCFPRMTSEDMDQVPGKSPFLQKDIKWPRRKEASRQGRLLSIVRFFDHISEVYVHGHHKRINIRQRRYVF